MSTLLLISGLCSLVGSTFPILKRASISIRVFGRKMVQQCVVSSVDRYIQLGNPPQSLVRKYDTLSLLSQFCKAAIIVTALLK